MVCGGLSNLTNNVSNAHLSCGPFVDYQPTTKPSWPLVMHNSVALLFLIITGIPIHNDSFPGKCSVVATSVNHP